MKKRPARKPRRLFPFAALAAVLMPLAAVSRSSPGEASTAGQAAVHAPIDAGLRAWRYVSFELSAELADKTRDLEPMANDLRDAVASKPITNPQGAGPLPNIMLYGLATRGFPPPPPSLPSSSDTPQ